jgi:RNA polymerase sigma-70 factor (ECF subfamily)
MSAPHHDPFAEPGDEQLMLAYGKGDARAFELLYARHKGTVYRLVLRATGDKLMAEDIYQEVWLSVVNARKRYQPDAKFMTWVSRIASNKLIDHFRRTGQWEPYLSDSDEDIEACAPGPGYQDPEARTHVNRQMARLLFCLEQLPPPQRQTFLMKEEMGLALDEIAAAMSAGREAIKSRLRYAVKRLKACMGELL